MHAPDLPHALAFRAHIEACLKNKTVFLFLDYDGSLAPIAPTPNQAILSTETKSVLQDLGTKDKYLIFIISGRSLLNIKSLVGIPSLRYIGNHGLEIEGLSPDLGDLSPVRFRQFLDDLKRNIAGQMAAFKGFFIEDKGWGLSVHYRALKDGDEPLFKMRLDQILHPFLLKQDIRIVSGKKVTDIKAPFSGDKGAAVLWLLHTYAASGPDHKPAVIYIGDDQTDEDAFRALDHRAITVHVGCESVTAARYRVDSPQEVTQLLQHLNNTEEDFTQ